MSYSDKDMRAATQVAYMNFDAADVKLHPDWTIKDHFEHNQRLAEEWKANDPALYKEITEGNYQNWKLIDYRNQNSADGFVGCCIDTGGGNAIVGFRGSESCDAEQVINDWIVADGGLMNSKETSQQHSAQEYIKYINEKYGNDFDSFSLTGHSLGGNLAEHAALTAPDDFYAKIDRTLSLDGPGFSDEYVKAHADEIRKHAGKIDHYQYSLVGAILNHIAGTNYRNMQASNDGGLVLKHDTKYIIYDKGGNMIEGIPDELALSIHGFTNSLDDKSILPGLFSVAELLFIMSNPRLAGLFASNMNSYMERYARESVQRYKEAQSARSTDFKIQTDALLSASDIISGCAGEMQAFCQEVEGVRSGLGIVLQLASLFTISIKLRIMEDALNKYAQHAKDMSSKTRECAELYLQYENDIKNIV